MKRFCVKKVKIVWRNSMIAGNPIVRSFQKFGVYDRCWQNDRYCWSPRPCGEFTSREAGHKYRNVFDEKSKADKFADMLNRLATALGDSTKHEIQFGILSPSGIKAISAYISDEDIDKLVIVKTSAR